MGADSGRGEEEFNDREAGITYLQGQNQEKLTGEIRPQICDRASLCSGPQ